MVIKLSMLSIKRRVTEKSGGCRWTTWTTDGRCPRFLATSESIGPEVAAVSGTSAAESV